MRPEKAESSRLGGRLAQKLWITHKRKLCFTGGAMALVLYGDSLLPLLGHGLHVPIGMLELLFEHFVQHIFDLSRHQAQLVTAWTGFIVTTCLAALVFRKVWVIARSLVAEALLRWKNLRDSVVADRMVQAWLRLAVATGAVLTATVLLMF